MKLILLALYLSGNHHRRGQDAGFASGGGTFSRIQKFFKNFGKKSKKIMEKIRNFFRTFKNQGIECSGSRITYCAIPMLDFEPELNVGLWTQFSLIKGSNLILELETDDPIGQFNNVFWTSANDSISLSKKLTCWVLILKGPTGQSSPESR